MKKLLFSMAFLSLTGLSFAQKKGIKFEQGQTWEEIKAKAKIENKYLFVDVFATWCGPCKAMDEEVFPNEELGKFMNERFISVKVQMDSNKIDTNQINSWFQIAHQMAKEYGVKCYPTYLFFDSNGVAVHKFTGQLDDTTFKKVALSALNPKKQYYNLMKAYRNKMLDYGQMPGLSRLSKHLGEGMDAKQIAEDYIVNYLCKLKAEEFFSKDNLTFVTNEGVDSFNSGSRAFSLIYKNPEKTDRIMGKAGFAQNMICWVIKKEELYDKLWNQDRKANTEQPDWKSLRAIISKRYTSHYADSLLLPTQLLFYQIEKNWEEYVRYVETAFKQYPPRREGRKFASAVGVNPYSAGTDAWALNEVAWKLFLNTDKLELLERGLAYSEFSIDLDIPKSGNLNQYLDTKANLLYKLGRVKEAIATEEKAIRDPFSTIFVKEYEHTLLKMRLGEATWPVLVTK
ncbi:hypothetical protein DBR11_17395 [Pedobacter sp. HMWF019]|uniref:thioredoxin family protein n=1 Tax=Pedobacter sp. HMWF019 TaxID=2056856 RepID=UPI000D3994D1|nr:thioredoxin family protein [Pedobacter sp. HMWF019]PTS97378.1 hypothetical protein DBR11_17395 [Pedobacter sp. HMWF019]